MTLEQWLDLEVGQRVEYNPHIPAECGYEMPLFLLIPLQYCVGEICTEEKYLNVWKEKSSLKTPIPRLIKFNKVENPNMHTWGINWENWDLVEEN